MASAMSKRHWRAVLLGPTLALVAAAATLAVFVGGVFVGLQWNRPAVFQARVMAEPAVDATPRPGAIPRPAVNVEQPASQHVRSRRTPTEGRRLPSRQPPPTEEVEVAPVEEPPPPVAAPAPPPQWQVLAGQLDYEAAREALEQQEGFETGSRLRQTSPSTLLHSTQLMVLDRTGPST